MTGRIVGAEAALAEIAAARREGRRIDLFGANLAEANLSGADLSGANLSGAWITGLPTVPWPTRVSGTTMAIGCQVHAHAEWAAFVDERIAAMHPDALAFWRQWRTHLLALCDAAAAWLAVMQPAVEDAS